MINGKEYAWEEVSVVISSKPTPIIGIQEIEYTNEKDWTEIYGKGSKPIAIGGGKEKNSGKIVLLQSEVEAIIKALVPKGKSLTNVTPLTISVSYQSLESGDPGVTDLLMYVRIGKLPKGMKTGDPNMVVELPLVIGDIQYNV